MPGVTYSSNTCGDRWWSGCVSSSGGYYDSSSEADLLMRQKEAMIDGFAAASSQQHLVYPVYPEREKVFPVELGPRATRIHEVDGNRLNEL